MIYPANILFNVEDYPLDQPASDGYQEIIEHAKAGLNSISCAQLPDFIRPKIVAEMQTEAKHLASNAIFHKADLNPYFSNPPEGTPLDHPLNRFSQRRHGMVPGDKVSRDGVIWAIFQNENLRRFVAQALGYEELYRYRDPYGCVNVNVQPVGCEFAWHFDNNDFTVSFGLKQPYVGGEFEYVPNLRSQDDQNYGEVIKVLDGDRTNIETLKLNPGDLQLFRGGYTLHRVTAPFSGERQSLLLSYVTDPDDIASSAKAISMWGTAHSDHFKRDRQINQSRLTFSRNVG